MGRSWGKISAWSKQYFAPCNPQYLHRWRESKRMRKPEDEGTAGGAGGRSEDDDGKTVSFRCLRCDAVVVLPRQALTGRPDPAGLALHLESGACSAGVLRFSDVNDAKRQVESANLAADEAHICQSLSTGANESKRPHVVLVGLENPKTPNNMGSVLRALAVFEPHDTHEVCVVYSGNRLDIASRFATDPAGGGENIQKLHVNSLSHAVVALKKQCVAQNVAFRCVAVDLVTDATPLHQFEHPFLGNFGGSHRDDNDDNSSAEAVRRDAVMYVFGPEDGSVSRELLEVCDDVVFIPTCGSLNLAATVNVVLYDRQAKRLLRSPSDTLRKAVEEAERTRNVNNHLTIASKT